MAFFSVNAQNGVLRKKLHNKNAVLNTKIDQEIYVERPEGFQKDHEMGEKSLSGLNLSGRNNYIGAHYTSQAPTDFDWYNPHPYQRPTRIIKKTFDSPVFPHHIKTMLELSINS